MTEIEDVLYRLHDEMCPWVKLPEEQGRFYPPGTELPVCEADACDLMPMLRRAYEAGVRSMLKQTERTVPMPDSSRDHFVLAPIDYSKISPGVRDLVRELREKHGFETCDSGDGSNYEAGMECAIPERHVFIKTKYQRMVREARFLQVEYPGAAVEVSWTVMGPAFILLWPDGKPGGAVDK